MVYLTIFDSLLKSAIVLFISYLKISILLLHYSLPQNPTFTLISDFFLIKCKLDSHQNQIFLFIKIAHVLKGQILKPTNFNYSINNTLDYINHL